MDGSTEIMSSLACEVIFNKINNNPVALVEDCGVSYLGHRGLKGRPHDDIFRWWGTRLGEGASRSQKPPPYKFAMTAICHFAHVRLRPVGAGSGHGFELNEKRQATAEYCHLYHRWWAGTIYVGKKIEWKRT